MDAFIVQPNRHARIESNQKGRKIFPIGEDVPCGDPLGNPRGRGATRRTAAGAAGTGGTLQRYNVPIWLYSFPKQLKLRISLYEVHALQNGEQTSWPFRWSRMRKNSSRTRNWLHPGCWQ